MPALLKQVLQNAKECILFCGKIVGTSIKQRKKLPSRAATLASRAKSTSCACESSNITVAHVEFHCQNSSNVHVKTAKVRYLPYLSSIHVKCRFEDNSIPKLCVSGSVPLSVRIESSKQPFVGCCSSFDIMSID